MSRNALADMLMPEGSGPNYNAQAMPTQVARSYNPTWRDRLASMLMGDQRPSPEQSRLVEGLTGSTGLSGGSGFGVADLIPGGQVLAAQEAGRKGDYSGMVMGMVGGPAGKVPGRGRIASALAPEQPPGITPSQQLDADIRKGLGFFSADAPQPPRPARPAQAPQSAGSLEDQIRAAFGAKDNPPQPPQGIKAYHGSPHDFEKFDMSKIGTGEGAQAYGHGLYFAEAEDVARSYQRDLSNNAFDPSNFAYQADMLKWMSGKGPMPEAPKKNPGRMYEVRINASPDDFLDWDKPLSAQSEKVRGAVRSLDAEKYTVRGADGYDVRVPGPDGRMTSTFSEADARRIAGEVGGEVSADRGEQVVKALGISSKPGQMEQKLRDAGIPGIKYLDQGSRTDGKGTRNYVLFRDDVIDIVKKYGVAFATTLYGAEAVNQAMGPQGPAPNARAGEQ